MKYTVFILFFVLTIVSVFSLGNQEKKNNPKKSTTIVGRVVIYGNEPQTFVGIVDGKGTEYAVYPPSEEEKLRSLQGHLIEFIVIFLDEPQAFGSLFLKGGTVTPIQWKIIN